MKEKRAGDATLKWGVDCHVHSSCSWDGSDPVEDYCRQAVGAGLHGIIFTDHVELDPEGKGYRRYDYDQARARVEEARVKHPELRLGLGVEVTYLPSLEGEIRSFLRGREFDMVIGSLHQVQGVDCSDPRQAARVWSGELDPRALLDAYFTGLRAAVESGLFDVLGHPDVFLRLGVEHWRHVAEEISHRMGEVLSLVVQAPLAIEVNTSGLRHGVGHPHPGPDTVAAYRSRGGTLITMGSDAHRVSQLAWGFPEVAGQLWNLGFRQVYFYEGRRPVALPLPRPREQPGAPPGGDSP
ncbi:MAG: histidinol-phosphatase HisJ family protein [Bacillota bacterium]